MLHVHVYTESYILILCTSLTWRKCLILSPPSLSFSLSRNPSFLTKSPICSVFHRSIVESLGPCKSDEIACDSVLVNILGRVLSGGGRAPSSKLNGCWSDEEEEDEGTCECCPEDVRLELGCCCCWGEVDGLYSSMICVETPQDES